ncbi:MAG: NAD-binding protein [Bacteroidia bacterium]|nr:NAD-binding protein [Bacteroidia bacterium]
MKFIPSQLMYFLQTGTARRNIRTLSRFIGTLLLMVVAYSVLFHYIMAAEGHEHSWITGLYWTLTVMTTLGFGDITFHSDLGRVFSIMVLFSGVVFLLILLPFTFIQFFYAPWLEAQSKARAPRELPASLRGHVLLTTFDPVSVSLIQKLTQYATPYVLLVEDLQRALDLNDQGIRVVLGERDDPETYKRLRVAQAALVVANGKDEHNTNIVYTVRELSPTVPIISTADSPDSVDILTLAGSSQVLQLADMLGKALARRTVGGDARSNIIGRFDELVIAEAPVNGTPLVGQTLSECKLRQNIGITVAGVWERGLFQIAGPDTLINNSTVLVLAGSEEQLARYDEFMCIYNPHDAFVLIFGGGRVGRAVAEGVRDRGLEFRIVERDPAVVRNAEEYVVGSAADLETLRKAGIERASTVVITTQNDDTNIYLTIYCRRLRPDVHIISRATLERNISTLHRAGADLVISYASLGSNTILNFLQNSRVMMLAEGLDIIRVPVPHSLAGSSLRSSGIRQRTGCSVIAIRDNDQTRTNPDPDTVLRDGMEMILIGTVDAERSFLEKFEIGLNGD